MYHYTSPFRLTHAIAHAHVSTRTNLSSYAICRTHMKSHIDPKMVLFHRIFFFQSWYLRLSLRVPSLKNAIYVNSVSQALITMARSGRSILSVFSSCDILSWWKICLVAQTCVQFARPKSFTCAISSTCLVLLTKRTAVHTILILYIYNTVYTCITIYITNCIYSI